MANTLIDDLAKIRELQGRDPLPDPRRIDGPPLAPPPLPENFGEANITDLDEFEDPEPSQTHVSPLVAAAQPKPEPRPELPRFDLVVLDDSAAYQGHEVKLTAREVATVKGTVLKALQREVRAQLASLVKLTPKRPRRSKPAGLEAPLAQAPKKRGRPRGSLLGNKP